MGSVATIVVAPLGTCAYGVELSSIFGRTCTYVVRTVGACIRIHRNNDIREGALLQLLAIEGLVRKLGSPITANNV